MDQLECNESMSSTPLTSSSSGTVPSTQPALPQPLVQNVVGGPGIAGQDVTEALRATAHQLPQYAVNGDAMVPGVNILRSIPSISSAVTY